MLLFEGLAAGTILSGLIQLLGDMRTGYIWLACGSVFAIVLLIMRWWKPKPPSVESVAAKMLADVQKRGTGGALLHPWSLFLQKRGSEWTFRARIMQNHSTEADWSILGHLVALVGVPHEVPMPETIEADPEATHEWRWKEKV